ncbi:MAG: ATP-dependent DNA helicase [Lachnospiraceae bacterium]|nr:ATP-dependent DNA helicase [Lachnospiraceae bacterium]
MVQMNDNQVRISVRHLVEFILRSGDIDNRRGGGRDVEAMQAGARLHRKIQKSMDGSYASEVMLRDEFPVGDVVICLEGRADGIITNIEGVTIDEIKGIYADVGRLEAPVPVHRAQAMCYAYLYGTQKELETISIRMTYATLETEDIRYFHEQFAMEELAAWFDGVIKAYGKWANFLYHHRMKRNQTIVDAEFPFAYRPGQKKLAASVYRTIEAKNRLFVQAPTGIGKTMSVIYPAVKAMGEGKGERIFYLTAKTITRTAAEDAFRILQDRGLFFSTVTLTAKEKLCPMEKCECNPDHCPRAKGHFDRVNEAVFDLIQKKERITREDVLEFAETYQVCPHEFDLDISDWVDGIICDYNYAFDPNVQLKRDFGEGIKLNHIFLIDEAHNLVERAREMYSAELYKEDFLAVMRLVKPYSKKLESKLSRCNKLLLELKRECEDWKLVESVDHLAMAVEGALGAIEDFEEENPHFPGQEPLGELYLNLRHFMNMYTRLDDCYRIYTEHQGDRFRLKLFCVNPVNNLEECLQKAAATIFFSATLLPIQYYRTLLSNRKEDYTVYLDSPFAEENRLLVIGRDVTSRYTRRTQNEFERIGGYIRKMIEAKQGNYLVFFPSYRYLDEVYRVLEHIEEIEILFQTPGMNEREKEEFLEKFAEEREHSLLGLCVMGGIFSEGIDLTGDRLIGVVVVGTGLPQVCNEREILKQYFDEDMGEGFAYAYQYPGMNKVLQAAGRVIRTEKDRGVIVLLDDRFLRNDYQRLFPREWNHFVTVREDGFQESLVKFWSGSILFE